MLTVKSTRKILLRSTWEAHNKMDLKEIGVNSRDWLDSVQDKD